MASVCKVAFTQSKQVYKYIQVKRKREREREREREICDPFTSIDIEHHVQESHAL